MVIAFVAAAVPQLPVTEYEMVTAPAVTPFTTPPITVALPLLALHVPPLTASVSVMFDPTLTLEAPVMVPVFVVLTVTVVVYTVAFEQPSVFVMVSEYVVVAVGVTTGL